MHLKRHDSGEPLLHSVFAFVVNLLLKVHDILWLLCGNPLGHRELLCNLCRNILRWFQVLPEVQKEFSLDFVTFSKSIWCLHVDDVE